LIFSVRIAHVRSTAKLLKRLVTSIILVASNALVAVLGASSSSMLKTDVSSASHAAADNRENLDYSIFKQINRCFCDFFATSRCACQSSSLPFEIFACGDAAFLVEMKMVCALHGLRFF
jgi:hypothetical protein